MNKRGKKLCVLIHAISRRDDGEKYVVDQGCDAARASHRLCIIVFDGGNHEPDFRRIQLAMRSSNVSCD